MLLPLPVVTVVGVERTKHAREIEIIVHKFEVSHALSVHMKRKSSLL